MTKEALENGNKLLEKMNQLDDLKSIIETCISDENKVLRRDHYIALYTESIDITSCQVAISPELGNKLIKVISEELNVLKQKFANL
jgi:hypothetical protein